MASKIVQRKLWLGGKFTSMKSVCILYAEDDIMAHVSQNYGLIVGFPF